jgi:hypothetical protein
VDHGAGKARCDLPLEIDGEVSYVHDDLRKACCRSHVAAPFICGALGFAQSVAERRHEKKLHETILSFFLVAGDFDFRSLGRWRNLTKPKRVLL